jgi:hypothetical protein
MSLLDERRENARKAAELELTMLTNSREVAQLGKYRTASQAFDKLNSVYN